MGKEELTEDSNTHSKKRLKYTSIKVEENIHGGTLNQHLTLAPLPPFQSVQPSREKIITSLTNKSKLRNYKKELEDRPHKSHMALVTSVMRPSYLNHQ